MEKPQILTPATLQATAAQLQAVIRDKPRTFDTCQVGIVLRSVLALELIAATLALLRSGSWLLWLGHMSAITIALLPAALIWLLTVCAMKNRLEHASRSKQLVFLLSMGALCGFYGGSILVVMGLLEPWQLLGSALLGLESALLMMIYLIWRAAAVHPAATAAQLTELQARIRPHFLFNALNSAIALIRNEPRKAEKVLEDLSELFRAALAQRDVLSSLGEEVRLAQHYLEIEQVRFGQRLRMHWQHDAALDDVPMPALILQPLVENAVKHGVEPNPDGADVWVRSRKRGERAEIRVRNTMGASPSKKGNGMALKNVRDRLQLLYDVECEFSAQEKDGGFELFFSVPLRRPSKA